MGDPHRTQPGGERGGARPGDQGSCSGIQRERRADDHARRRDAAAQRDRDGRAALSASSGPGSRLRDGSRCRAIDRAQQQLRQCESGDSDRAGETRDVEAGIRSRAKTFSQSLADVSEAQLQATVAAFGTDKASLAVAEAQVRALTATAYQEWGSVIGKSLVDESPIVTHLIERQDFLLQITLPPGVILAAPPATASIATGKSERAPITFVSPATRIDPEI